MKIEILVDTSVLLDVLKGKKNEKADLFKAVCEKNLEWAVSAITYQEVLQGAYDKRELSQLKSYLNEQEILLPPPKLEFYDDNASFYFHLRRNGITVRNIGDVIIAGTAITYGLKLLHNDRDFDNIAAHISSLNILTAL